MSTPWMLMFDQCWVDHELVEGSRILFGAALLLDDLLALGGRSLLLRLARADWCYRKLTPEGAFGVGASRNVDAWAGRVAPLNWLVGLENVSKALLLLIYTTINRLETSAWVWLVLRRVLAVCILATMLMPRRARWSFSYNIGHVDIVDVLLVGHLLPNHARVLAVMSWDELTKCCVCNNLSANVSKLTLALRVHCHLASAILLLVSLLHSCLVIMLEFIAHSRKLLCLLYHVHFWAVIIFFYHSNVLSVWATHSWLLHLLIMRRKPT